MKVYLVIDDYTPDAGSSIYGAFSTYEKAEQYLTVGLLEEYGDDVNERDCACIETMTVE